MSQDLLNVYFPLLLGSSKHDLFIKEKTSQLHVINCQRLSKSFCQHHYKHSGPALQQICLPRVLPTLLLTLLSEELPTLFSVLFLTPLTIFFLARLPIFFCCTISPRLLPAPVSTPLVPSIALPNCANTLPTVVSTLLLILLSKICCQYHSLLVNTSANHFPQRYEKKNCYLCQHQKP